MRRDPEADRQELLRFMAERGMTGSTGRTTLAAMLRCDPSAIYRWQKGQKKVPHLVAELLRCWEEHGVPGELGVPAPPAPPTPEALPGRRQVRRRVTGDGK